MKGDGAQVLTWKKKFYFLCQDTLLNFNPRNKKGDAT